MSFLFLYNKSHQRKKKCFSHGLFWFLVLFCHGVMNKIFLKNKLTFLIFGVTDQHFLKKKKKNSRRLVS